MVSTHVDEILCQSITDYTFNYLRDTRCKKPLSNTALIWKLKFVCTLIPISHGPLQSEIGSIAFFNS